MFVSRREMLSRAATGFGMIGLAGSMQSAGLLSAASGATSAKPPQYKARAKRVIFLMMNGAPSHVDTFDPKPALAKHIGKQPGGELYRKNKGSGFMPSPFRFRPHGESGVVMSELLPHLSGVADDLCVLRSMHTDVPNHEPGLLMMNCGNLQPVRPCLGLLGVLRIGHRKRKPADVRDAGAGSAGGRPAIVVELVSARRTPGDRNRHESHIGRQTDRQPQASHTHTQRTVAATRLAAGTQQAA